MNIFSGSMPGGRRWASLCGCVVFLWASGTAQAESGSALFVKNCAPCHGKDGRAKTPVARKLGVKDLTISKLPEADIEKQMIEGKKAPDGQQKMPSFKGVVSPEDIKVIAQFVMSLRR